MAHIEGDSRDIDGHKVLGTFSTDKDRRYCNDDRNRRFFLKPDDEPNFNYTRGFKNYVEMGNDSVISLNNVTQWMRDHRQVLKDRGVLDTKRSRLNVDFVGRRGVFGRLLEARSNKDHEISLMVTLHRGTYYISETSGHWQTSGKQNVTGQMIAASSKIFLQFVRSKDGCTPDKRTPVNDNASYYAMMSANCGKHRLLFSFEVQAEKRNATTPPPGNYVNVRTNGQQHVHPMKALKWWAPNALSDIPQIVCGWRDDKRKIVKKVEYIQTDQLPTKYAQNKWQPGACIEKMESLLSQIKELVQDDDPNSVYHLTLERVEGGGGTDQRLRSRRFIFNGKREDDFTLIEESKIRDIIGRLERRP